MSHQSSAFQMTGPIDAGPQVAQLRHVLRLVEELAGQRAATGADDAALDESARISSAYDRAMPIVQRRFEALVAETATWSTAGVEALLRSGANPSRPAARRLAGELATALRKLSQILRL